MSQLAKEQKKKDHTSLSREPSPDIAGPSIKRDTKTRSLPYALIRFQQPLDCCVKHYNLEQDSFLSAESLCFAINSTQYFGEDESLSTVQCS